MARKPRGGSWAADYAIRKAAAEAKGKRGSAARGHAPPPGKTEAQVRREREEREAEATGKLTTAERQAIKQYVNRVADAQGIDNPEELIAKVQAWATREGYERFKQERSFIKRLGMQGMTIQEMEARVNSGEAMPDVRLYFYRRKEFMRGRTWTPRPIAQREARRRRERRQRRQARKRKVA